MDTTEPNNVAETSPERDKAVRLFTYLKELCALRSAQVRNIGTYDQTFWLNDLPRHKLCHSSIWRLVDPPAPAGEEHTDLWIEVRKPVLKSPPELPDELEPWIKEEELSDSSLDEPGIYEQIPLSALQDDSDNTDPNILASINDYPNVFEKWVDYVETKWKPWANEDRDLQKVQKAYNHLFNIYQRQEKLGEQYEVIMGAGLLIWRSPNSGEVKRHVLVLQARIEFDRIKGIVSAGLALDGPQPMLECSMLETTDRPNPTDLTSVENDTLALDGDPWNADALERVLGGFANALPTAGDYSPLLDHVGASSEKAIVKLAPALILRKRTRRTFEGFYGQIVDQVKGGEELPESIRRIVGVVDDSPSEDTASTESQRHIPSSTLDDPEVYFPLLANDEQKRIVHKVEQRAGVLVQGPPGTGKSHTICNLIAHFLAKGKRVLVTSETPRALEVLRNKLPPEITELCVVWLGSGPDSQEALRKSVEGITGRKANWDAHAEQHLTEEYARRLDAERREQAQLRHELRACREADVYQHSDVFGRYSGTLQQIAVQVNQERDQFGWFVDRPGSGAEPSVSAEDLVQMARIRRELPPDLVEQLTYQLFPTDQLISPNEFRRFVDAEQEADLAQRQARNKRSYPGYAQLSGLDRAKRDKIKDTVERIVMTQDILSRHFLSWPERVSREVCGDQDGVWRQIHTATVDHIDHIENLLREHGTLEVKGLEGKDLRLVEEHATALEKHLVSGGRLRSWLGRPQVVKNGLYLITSVTVNGKLCDNADVLRQLGAWVSICSRIKELGDLWKGITAPPTGDASLLCSSYRDLCKPIELALTLHHLIQEVRRTCEDSPGTQLPAWHCQEEVRAFHGALDVLTLEEDFAAAQQGFTSLGKSLTDFNRSGRSHKSTDQLLHAVTERNVDLYQDAYESLSSLHTLAGAYNWASAIHERLSACAPQTCVSYDQSSSELAWSERFASFDTAWVWAKSDRWISEMRDKDRSSRIRLAIESSASREREALKNLAASKAWQHCIRNLRERERMALVAWSQAVAKIRGGTGKYAESYRETARQKLDECRGAIPAWVMPLYQVVQTIRPQRHQFDVVIVDEASQSGPEAILLNYIAEKIIVVGDEKQITPMHVGVDREQVQYLRRKHLQDIPHADALDLESSLFAQAELRFPDRIRLREHFRCMPEIIQFCNRLSYPNEPLIPLRQHGADRLQPIRITRVEDGYRQGASDNILNPPEAKRIAAQIAECCEDPAYAGKTFGVISLMGTRQSEMINSLLLGKDGIGAEEMEKRRLVCGRPYDFQGDERDIIFLSMVDAPQEGQPCRMIRDADTQRRLNVAVSRARDQLWLFHSPTLNELRPDCLRHRLLEYCLNPTVQQPDEIGETSLAELRRMACNSSIRQSKRRGEKVPGTPFDSWFEVDVFFKIIDRGYRVLPQFPVHTRRIDLVVEGLRGRLGVECDGDEVHMDQWEEDQIRQRELERVGWIIWHVRGSDFYRDPDGALAELWHILDGLKITPRHTWESERRQAAQDSMDHDRSSPPDTSSENDSIFQDDEDGSQDEVAQEEAYTIADDGGDHLVLGSEHVGSRRRRPEAMPPLMIQNAILQSLQKCANHTCTVKSLTSRVLKELGVTTRGNPRLEFEKRVMRNLGAMKRKALVTEYKAKNKRIRLLGSPPETGLFE